MGGFVNINKITLSVVAIAVLLVSGCSPKLKPTDNCRYNIHVSDLYSVEDFNYIDFFDLAVEVSKDHNFPPPMKYDKSDGLLVFGHEDVDTMPGHKMVVYMWVDSPFQVMTENVCLNFQILDVRGSYLTDSTTAPIMIDFINDLEDKYKKYIEDTKRIMEKYQVN